MDVNNCSPFPHMVFEKATTRNRHFDVMVVAATCDLVHGQLAPISQTQRSITCADRYAGHPRTSALLEETHLIVGKKRCDIHLLGHAYTQGCQAQQRWPVGVRVGNLVKTATVTGPRHWQWSLRQGWHLSQPEPVQQVALHMGMAYGGHTRRANYQGPASDDLHDDQAFDTYKPNPVGKGYLDPRALSRAQVYPAAQIESLENPIQDIRKRYQPVAFGPLPRWHPQRAKHAGTYDGQWRQAHAPYLPQDFDFAFYQSAQPDLIALGWLDGDEPLVLHGCLPEGRLETLLPGIRMLAVLTDARGVSQSAALRLDTLNIHLDQRQIQLIWRYAVPKDWQLAKLLLAAIPNSSRGHSQTRPVYYTHHYSPKRQRGPHG